MELKEIKGLGSQRIATLNNAGIFSCLDLINYFPKKYYDFNKVSQFENFKNEFIMIKVRLVASPKIIHASRRLSFVQATAQDLSSNQNITLIWFNQNFLAKTLVDGEELFVYGKSSKHKKNYFNVSLFKNVKDVNLTELFAVYKTFENIGQQTIKNSVKAILNQSIIHGVIPDIVREKYGIEALDWAYNGIHFPQSEEDLKGAEQRINLENALIFACINNERKLLSKVQRGFIYPEPKAVFDKFKSLLPFTLTTSQVKAIDEINTDLTSKTTMNRLIEGDVGCGKTVVSLWPMYFAVECGFQAVLMAPTEILARQHFEFFKQVLEPTGINVVFLSASLSLKEKNEIYNQIKSGEAQIIIGTQALLNADLTFHNLKVAVVDEQHRFGVNMRAELAQKGENIDYLTLSATPIPRSVALVIYGGLDLTRIENRPNAVNIQTNIVNKVKENDMWLFIKKEIEQDRVAYVVCPKIDDSEDDSLISTMSLTKQLKTIFNKDIVCELNGKMKDNIKTQILSDFKSGKVKVLVSTTVVEVGVDAKNAGIIVIMNPDRFGLATLHQLRGRVSRDGRKSYCFCLCDDNIGVKAVERLYYFKNNNNGFDIADYDLKMRGAGDAFGTRQHGEKSLTLGINLSSYKFAEEIFEDIKCYPEAYTNLKNIAEQKYPTLVQNIILN